MKRVLIIEDDKDIVELVRYNLANEGFQVSAAYDGSTGLSTVKKSPPDLLILDLMLPKLTGLDICREVRRDDALNRLPILMLTARGDEADRVVGLEMGADDYVTKPFSPRELLARIRAILRRAKEKGNETKVLRIGDLTIDFSRIEVAVKDKPVELTAKEFELLKTLAQAHERVLSRDYLLDTIWGFDHALEIQTRTVDVHIRTLRKKLKSEAKRIVTVKNYGYRFDLGE